MEWPEGRGRIWEAGGGEEEVEWRKDNDRLEVEYGEEIRLAVVGILRHVPPGARGGLATVRVLVSVTDAEDGAVGEGEGGEGDVDKGSTQGTTQGHPDPPRRYTAPCLSQPRPQTRERCCFRALLTSPLDKEDGTFPACVLTLPRGVLPRRGMYTLLLEGRVLDAGGRAWTMTPEGGGGKRKISLICGVGGGW